MKLSGRIEREALPQEPEQPEEPQQPTDPGPGTEPGPQQPISKGGVWGIISAIILALGAVLAGLFLR